MRWAMISVPVLLLAACTEPVSDRPGGVGFESYPQYQARRLAESEQRGAPGALMTPAQQQPYSPPIDPTGAPPMVNGQMGGVSTTGTPTAADLAQAGIGSAPLPPAGTSAFNGTVGVGGNLPNGVPPANPAITDYQPYYPPGSAGAAQQAAGQQPSAPIDNGRAMSDEQDFSAVSSRESIESDKQRIEQNRQNYQQIAPTALPARDGDAAKAVDLIQYALNAPNRMGEAIYPRSRIALTNSERACGRYDTAEAAQQAFLQSGGPQRDSKNLDPDGDGFACYWDPTPFQKARN